MFAASKTAAQATAANYIEDVFSTYLYTGNGSTQTITNGIDLSGKGGLTWIKFRNPAADGITGEHCLFDTARGATYRLRTNATNPQGAVSTSLTSFNSDGFTLGAFDQVNSGYLSRQTYVSWTFRKQPKFFDVVTYTGSASTQTISHNLGAVPGCIIVKAVSGTSSTSDWAVYHRGITDAKNNAAYLNTTAASFSTSIWNNADPTATTFQVYGDAYPVNNTGTTYVAYLFAHNAGGFGLTGTDNVISCGSFTVDSTGAATVNLGYEPQWVLVKATSNSNNWVINDNMRGMFVSSTYNPGLMPNASSAENTIGSETLRPTATGFYTDPVTMNPSYSYIYIAIRRGPMKTPTSGTSVFSPNTTSNDGNPITTNFPVDMFFDNNRAGNSANTVTMDRLRGSMYSSTASTAAEADMGAYGPRFGSNTTVTPYAYLSGSEVVYSFRRAPGFFDEVCYTGTGATQNVTHNLGVAPELMIVKCRSNGPENWPVMVTSLGSTGFINLNGSGAFNSANVYWNATAPTATQFTVSSDGGVGGSGRTYVAYLFASCPGVSKVGSYTGTGTTKQIDCGFTGGARFVLIRRTDSTGDWYVWDSARGIVAGNDPYLLLNSTAAEVTSTDYVDTYSAGFEISSTAPAAINANGGTFIFLAIA